MSEFEIINNPDLFSSLTCNLNLILHNKLHDKVVNTNANVKLEIRQNGMFDYIKKNNKKGEFYG